MANETVLILEEVLRDFGTVKAAMEAECFFLERRVVELNQIAYAMERKIASVRSAMALGEQNIKDLLKRELSRIDHELQSQAQKEGE